MSSLTISRYMMQQMKEDGFFQTKQKLNQMSKKYKCIKTFPGVSEIGKIAYEHTFSYECGNNSFKKIDVEESPEFWEEIKEPKFQILATKTNIKFSLSIENITTEIYEILRLSDNETFAIGDKIKCQNSHVDKPEAITKIELNKEGTPCLFTNSFHNNGINIFKAIKCEKIFTTEDGVDLFEKDVFWHVDKFFCVGKGVLATKPGVFQPLVGYKHFSTEKAAKDWVDMNKPKFSKNDLSSALKGYKYGDWIVAEFIKVLNSK